MSTEVEDFEETPPTLEELEAEVNEMAEELATTEAELEATEAELDQVKEELEQLRTEREMEGWEEWGKMAESQLTKAEIDQTVAQSHVAADALVAAFRRGLVAGIGLMERQVRINIDASWAMSEKK